MDLQRVGEAVLADGQVTTEKLADAAVTDAKMADGSVIEAKLADLAISTGKLKDNVVTLAKADGAMRIHNIISDNTEFGVLGTAEEEIKILRLIKSTSDEGFDPKLLRINTELKTSDVASAANLKIYIDEEATPRISLTSISTVYEIATGSADISDLASGKHSIKVKLASAGAAATASNQLFYCFVEK